MTKTQATALIEITVNTAIATLARVHGVSIQTIGRAISAGNVQIMDEMAQLIERMEASL